VSLVQTNAPSPADRAARLEPDALVAEAFEDAPLMMGIVELCEEEDILHVRDNVASCAFFGVPPGATAGRRALALGVSPVDVRAWRGHYLASAASAEPVRFEHVHGAETLRVAVRPTSPAPSGRPRFFYVAESVTALKRAEARTATLLDRIDEAFFSVDREWRLTYANREAEKLLGEASTLRGRAIADVFPGYRGSPFEDAYVRAMRLQEPQTLRAYDPNHARTYEARAYPTADGLSVFFRDVSRVVAAEQERERLVAEVAASEARYRSTFHAAPVGVAHVGADGRWLRFNDWICAFTGYSRPELEGLTFADLTHPEDLERDWAEARRLLAGESPSYTIEKRYVRKDGGVVWAQLSVSMLRAEDGAPLHFIAVVQDIDARKRAELALSATRAELDSVLMGMSEGLHIATLDGRIVKTNAAARQLLADATGGEGDAGGTDVALAWEATYPDGAPMPPAEGPLARVIRGEVLSNYVVRARRRGANEVRVLSYNGRIVQEPGGTPLAVLTFRDVSKLEKIETELRARERELRTITELTPDIIARIDRELRHVFVNQAIERTTGLPASAFLGKTNQELGMPPELCARWDAVLEQVFETGEEGRIEFQYEGPSGRRDFVSRIVPERGPNGTIEHLLGVAHDVTDSKAAEASLRAASRQKDEFLEAGARREAWLEAIVEGSPIGIAVFDRDLRFVRINASLARLNGLPAEAHLGKLLSEVLPVTAELLEGRYREVLDTGRPIVDLKVSTLWQNQRHHSLVSIYPIAVRGAVEGVVGIVQSVTEREREDRRRDLLARAGRIAVTAREVEGVARQVASLFVPEHADAACLYLRNDAGDPELVAASAADASLEANICAKLGAQVGALLQRAVTVGDHTWWAANDEPGGELATVGVRSLLILPLVSYGGVVGAFALARCTEEPLDAGLLDAAQEVAVRAATAIENVRLFAIAQAERRRADEANRAKDEFLAVVSHELRTPLNAILGWARMLVGGMTPPDKTQKALQTIERNARTQAQLIEDLLDYSRIITGKLRLEREPFDVARMVESALEVVAPAAAAKGVHLTPRLDPEIGVVSGDPTRLQQAVWNLLTNAVKFTSKGGHVEVALESGDGAWVVSVSDDGAGIAPEFLPYVFDRFRQAEMGAKRRFGGLGLGLSIVRHIVELHGGTVDALSDGSGAGATFRMRIPLMPAWGGPPVLKPTGDVRGRPPLAEVVPALRGVRVLVVDDEEDARDVVAAMLQSVGAEVVTAANAQQGLERFGEHVYDLILSDIGMPGEDGFEFVEKLRKLPRDRGGDTIAIALTAYARSEDRARALLSGFDGHLPKPVDPAELIAVVASARRRR